MNLTCSQIAKAAGLRFDRKSGNQIIYYCPNHDDTNGSLNLNNNKNVWMCGPCGESGGAWAFAGFLSGCKKKNEVIQWLVERGLVEENKIIKTKPVGVYTYKDLNGKEFYQVRKYIATTGKKSYAQFHRDEQGDWKPGVDGITMMPYKIESWIDKPWVVIVEGEKDVDNLSRWDIPATTNPQGAGSWRAEFNQYFKGKKVVIIPDNDEVGLRHSNAILENLIRVAVAVKIVRLPDLPPKGDYSDWVSKCHGTKAALLNCFKEAKWATLADVGDIDNPSGEAKILVRRMNCDIGDLFERVKPNYDEAWTFMKDNETLWDAIKEAENRLDESCKDGDPVEIIKNRCLEYKMAFKAAVVKFLDEVVNKKNETN